MNATLVPALSPDELVSRCNRIFAQLARAGGDDVLEGIDDAEEPA